MILTLIFLSSCDKEAVPPFSQGAFSECHGRFTWDENAIRNGLHGKWKWLYQSCSGAPEVTGHKDSLNVELEFNADSTVHLWVDGNIHQTSTWTLSYKGDSSFEIRATPSILQLFGIVHLCDDQVGFFGNAIDLCDNFFEKTQ